MIDILSNWQRRSRYFSLFLLTSFVVGMLLPYWEHTFIRQERGLVRIEQWGWEWVSLGWAHATPFTDNTALGAAWFALPVFLFGLFLLHRNNYRSSTVLFLLAMFLHSIFWHDGQLRSKQKYVGAYWHFGTMFLAYSWSLARWVAYTISIRGERPSDQQH